MAMTIDPEREAFEKWADENDRNTSMLYGEYVNDTTDSAWDAWQARAQLSQPAQAVDVGAIRDVIAWMEDNACGEVAGITEQIDKLTRALAGEKAEDGLAARIRARLPIIRASTGNPLFDAGTHDACEKIAALLPTPPTDGEDEG